MEDCLKMAKIEKFNLKSKDIKIEQIEKIKRLFPEAVSEGKIDFEKLKRTLGEEIDASKERYNLSWAGKSGCFKIIQEPSVGTLKPVRKDSVDFDNTENLFIEGDNLEVSKLLQKSYYEKVKMIYIDPPYNTGKEFIYPDKYAENLQTYLQYTGQIDSNGKKFSTNTDSSGRYHSNWMNMMYPRLFLAKNLLQQEGAIFISIGQEELHNLTLLCNEIFGEDNRVGVVSRLMKSGGNKGQFFSPNLDYVLVYAKNIEALDFFRLSLEEEYADKVYTLVETSGKRKGERYREMGLYQAGLEKRANQRYWIKCPDGTFVIPPGKAVPVQKIDGAKVAPNDGDGVWRWIHERYKAELDANNIVFKKTTSSSLIDADGNQSKWNIYSKIWLNDRLEEGRVPTDLITKFENRISSAELKGLDIPFDFAKPSKLISYLISFIDDSQAIVLDFFAGSGTTAQAVLDLNKDDGGNRKFICVQLPEPTPEDSETFKAGYKNIAEICKERIRRVIKKIKEEQKSEQKTLKEKKKQDLGFKVFKLDNSNFKAWDTKATDVQKALTAHIEQIKEAANPEEVLYEILLKDGFELTTKIEKVKLANKEVYSMEENMLLICLDNNLSLSLFKDMKKLNPHRVVVLDKGFKDNDQLKTNAVQSLGKNDADEFILRSI